MNRLFCSDTKLSTLNFWKPSFRFNPLLPRPAGLLTPSHGKANADDWYPVRMQWDAMGAAAETSINCKCLNSIIWEDNRLKL